MGLVALPKRTAMLVSELREVVGVGREMPRKWRDGGCGAPDSGNRSKRFLGGVCRARKIGENGGGLT